MTDWGGKLAGAIVRIAGLLHLAGHARDGWDRPITLATLEAAIEIGDYYTHHAMPVPTTPTSTTWDRAG
jgi:hypothetical protein